LEPKDIVFDYNCEFFVSLNNTKDKIGIKLIERSNYKKENITEKNKTEISNFVNNFDVWNEISINAILGWANENFNTKLKAETIKLSHIYLLFDEYNDQYYGLLYNLDIDETDDYKKLMEYFDYCNTGIGVEIYGDTLELNIINSGDKLFW